MKTILGIILFIAVFVTNAIAQNDTIKTQNIMSIEKEITEIEKLWASAIQKQDETLMDRFLADNYFLAIAIQGMPLRIIPRSVWLDNLKFYKTEFFIIDDIKVHLWKYSNCIDDVYSTCNGKRTRQKRAISTYRYMG